MSISVHLKLVENTLPRYARAFKQPLDVVADNKAIGSICWGKEILFEIPDGKHELVLKYKKGSGSNTLHIETHDGDTVNLNCILDTGVMKLFLMKEGESTSDIKQLKQQARKRDAAGCATAIVYFIGVLYLILLTLILLFADVDPTDNIYLLIFLVPALIFLVLGFLTRRKSIAALITATVIHTLGVGFFVWAIVSYQQNNAASASEKINAAIHGGALQSAVIISSSSSTASVYLWSFLGLLIIGYVISMVEMIKGARAIITLKSEKLSHHEP